MNNDVNPGKPEKKHIGADLVIPVAALAFTIYYISTIIDLPWTAKVSTYFIAGVLVSVIAAFAVFSLLALLRGEADLGFQRLTEPRSFLPRRAILFALTLGYIVAIEWGGFTLTTFVFLSLAMLLLSRGQNWKFVLGLSATLAFGGYLLFIYAFEVRFPAGPIEAVLDPVMVEVGALFGGAF